MNWRNFHLVAHGPRSYSVVDDEGKVHSPYPQSRKWATRTMTKLSREQYDHEPEGTAHPDTREL